MNLPHDYHTHTNFSCDCRFSMREMCASARAQNLPELGITEHYDLHPLEACRNWFRLDEWAAELARCRRFYAGRLTLRAGIELGEPHIFQKERQAMLARYPFDYCLGSLHYVGDHNLFDDNFYQSRTPAEAFRLFFEELERMTASGGFDILSHFDLPARRALPVYGRYDPREHEDCIRPVLKNCVERGIALDINTALLRKLPNGVLTPGVEILRWYKEMGGERITLGSDSHQPENIAAHLDVALAAAKEAGLKYVTMFEQRQAKLVPIQ
jgi:histidinol-phosphatase (PHP family)